MIQNASTGFSPSFHPIAVMAINEATMMPVAK